MTLDLDAIRGRVERYKRQPSELHPYSLWTQATADITALLEEVEELRADLRDLPFCEPTCVAPQLGIELDAMTARAEAARNAALEEAAGVADRVAVGGIYDSPHSAIEKTKRQIAAAIRALKGDKP